MKTALITDNLNSGGAQRQLVTLAVGLKKRGISVIFIVYNPGYHYEHMLTSNGIALFKLLKRSKYDPFLPIRVGRLLKKEGISTVIAYLFTPTLISVIANILLGNRIKVITSERSFSGYKSQHLTTKLARSSYHFVHKITVNSLSQYNFLIRNYPQHLKKIKYIPNGLDLSHFRPITKKKRPEEPLRILCVGHVNSVKNPKLVIHALSLLPSQEKLDLQVTWIGRTFNETGKPNEYYDECRALIFEKNLDGKWKWESEIKNMIHCYQQSDLLIHASVGEGFSNVIMEALACGLPVVASDVNDNSLIIKNKENGFLFSSGDAYAIMMIITYYARMTEQEKQKLSENARETATRHFSEDTMISQYISLLD